MFIIITSTRIIYSIIDSGQPFLTPVSIGKDRDKFPLILIRASMLLYRASMIDIIFGPYPNFFNVFRRNFLSTLSKAFSWSKVVIEASTLLVFAKEIMSVFFCRFSVIVLPLTAVTCSVLIISSKEPCKWFAKIFARILFIIIIKERDRSPVSDILHLNFLVYAGYHCLSHTFWHPSFFRNFTV